MYIFVKAGWGGLHIVTYFWADDDGLPVELLSFLVATSLPQRVGGVEDDLVVVRRDGSSFHVVLGRVVVAVAFCQKLACRMKMNKINYRLLHLRCILRVRLTIMLVDGRVFGGESLGALEEILSFLQTVLSRRKKNRLHVLVSSFIAIHHSELDQN